MSEYPLNVARDAILRSSLHSGPVGLALTRGAVRTLLDHTLDGLCPPDVWSLQGFGMLRMYLDDRKTYRLHVWHDGHCVENVSDIHTHPWDLQSRVVAGLLTNVRYMEAPNRTQRHPIHRLLIVPGEDAKKGLAKPDSVSLRVVSREAYHPGAVYNQRADEIHRTVFAPGTVTVIDRERRGLPDRAYSYYRGSAWVDAAPRPAKSLDEIRVALTEARKIIDGELDLHQSVLY